MKISKFLILAVLCLLLSSRLNAQTANPYDTPSLPSLIPGLEERIDVIVSPENPAPNQVVNLSLQAFGTDLNRATISWSVNGSIQKSGIGATTFTLTSGRPGAVSDILIYILPINGSKITKEIRIAPASVDLVWETSSYVPPFYKGKKLYPPSGSLTVLALPNLIQNGSLIGSKSLTYKWTVNNSVLGDKSGYGKDILNLSGDVLNRPWKIEVEASSVQAGITGGGSINISSYQPLTLFYEDNPLYGILFNRSLLGEFNLKNPELTLRTLPYYFSLANPASANYSWSINSGGISVPPNQNTVVFRKPDDADGQSLVAVKTSNPANFLQSASANLKINFSKNSNVPLPF